MELSPEAMKRADIRVEAVRPVHQPRCWSRRRSCSPNADRIARVGPRVAGRIAQVMVPLGANVRAGQPLATIRSPEAAEATATLDSARAAESLARRSLARERELFEKKVSAQREVIEAEAALANAEAGVRAAEAASRRRDSAPQVENERRRSDRDGDQPDRRHRHRADGCRRRTRWP